MTQTKQTKKKNQQKRNDRNEKLTKHFPFFYYATHTIIIIIKTTTTGIANMNNTVDIQELAGAKTPSSTLNGANNKGIFRNQAKAVDAACANRSDLRKKALARVSAVHKAGRVARAKK